MVQTRSKAKAQANAPTMPNAKPVTQRATLKVAKIPIKTKRKILKHCPVE